MFHKPFICMVCCLAFSNVKAQQSNLTVETIAANVFNTTVTPGSYESSNGLTYFIDKGTIANVSVTGVAGKAVWTDGTAAGTHSVNIPAIKEHLGIIDSAYYGVDEQSRLFRFTPSAGVQTLSLSFQKACEFVRLGNDYYFLGVPTNDTLASIWKVDSQGVFSQMATVNGVNAQTSRYPLFLKTNGQFLLSLVSGKLHRFDANSPSGILLGTFQYYYSLTVDRIANITYFCLAGDMYQTDGTMSGTQLLPGVPTSPALPDILDIVDFKIYRGHIYMVERNIRIIGSRYSIYWYNIRVHDGVREVQSLRVTALPDVYLDFKFKETQHNGLFIFANGTNQFSRERYFDVYRTIAPLQPFELLGTHLRVGSNSSCVNNSSIEYNGNIVYNSTVYPNPYTSVQNATRENGYFEIDSATQRLMPISANDAQSLALSNGKVYGVSRKGLQVLVNCPYVNNRPIISNVLLDTITGVIRVRWEGPANNSVSSYIVYSVNEAASINSPMVAGTALDTIVSQNGQQFFEYTRPIPTGQGIFYYAIRVNSALGICADTSLMLGSVRLCAQTPRPTVSVNVRKINDLHNAMVNVIISPISPEIQSVILLKNGLFLASLSSSSNGAFNYFDTTSNFADEYSVSVSSTSLCRGTWVVPTTLLDSFSCSSFQPQVNFSSVRLKRNPNGCPELSVFYNIQSSYEARASLALGGNNLNVFTTNIGLTVYQQQYPITQNSRAQLSISAATHQYCPDYVKEYPIAINPDSLFFKIDTVWVTVDSNLNQVRLNWSSKNRTLPSQIFEIYRNGQIIGSNLTYAAQDSVMVFVDTFAVEGALNYQVNSLNYGQCNVSKNLYYFLSCNPSNPSKITNLKVREVSVNQRLVTWKVEGGRTFQTLTKATIKRNAPLGLPQVLMAEIDITNNPLTDTYSAMYYCFNKYEYVVDVYATNPFSDCDDDAKEIICDCNSIAQKYVSVVFPNPVLNTFNLIYPEGIIKAGVQLYDGVGALVREYGEQPNYCNLDMSGLPQGFYYLRLQYSTSFEMVKMEKL